MKHFLGCLCKDKPIYSWQTLEIPSRDTNVIELIPDNAYAYFIFDSTIEGKAYELTPDQIKNISSITYLGGTIYSFDEVKKIVREQNTQIFIGALPGVSMTQICKMKHFIYTSGKTWLPFFDGDVLINIKFPK